MLIFCQLSAPTVVNALAVSTPPLQQPFLRLPPHSECCVQAIRRGTWVAVQLQLVFILVMALLAIQARLYLSGLPDSILVRTSVTAVPCIVYLAILVVLDKQLWRVPAKSAPAVGDASASQEPEEATAPAEVDSRQREPAVEDDSEAERPSEQLVRAVSEICASPLDSTSCTMSVLT